MVCAALLCSASACAAAESTSDNTPSVIEFEGEAYYLLTGDELKKTFQGKSVTTYLKNLAEGFYKNGQYMLTGERLPVRGEYAISDNNICVHYNDIRKKVNCFTIYKNKHNEYVQILEIEGKSKLINRRIYINSINE